MVKVKLLEVKNEYNIEEIVFAFNNYLTIWLDEVIKRVDKKIIQNMILNRGYVDIGALDTFTRTNKKEIEESIQNRIKKEWNVSKDTKKIPFASEKFPILIFMKYLTHFKSKNINIIKRIYNRPIYSREEFKKTHLVFDLFPDDAVKENLKIVYTNLSNVYNYVVLQVVPKLKDYLIPFTDSTKLIIEIKKDDRILEEDTPFSRNKYYLKGREKENFEIIFFSEINDSIPDEVRRDKIKKLEFMGKDYEVHRYGHETVRDIYKPLPLFNKVKEGLSERFFNLFIDDHKSIISKLIE